MHIIWNLVPLVILLCLVGGVGVGLILNSMRQGVGWGLVGSVGTILLSGFMALNFAKTWLFWFIVASVFAYNAGPTLLERYDQWEKHREKIQLQQQQDAAEQRRIEIMLQERRRIQEAEEKAEALKQQQIREAIDAKEQAIRTAQAARLLEQQRKQQATELANNAATFVAKLYTNTDLEYNQHIEAVNLADSYAERVHYYGKEAPLANVLGEKEAYFQRWPTRKHAITRLKPQCGPERCRVTGTVEFDYENATATSKGVADFEYILIPIYEGCCATSFKIETENGKPRARQITPIYVVDQPEQQQHKSSDPLSGFIGCLLGHCPQ